MSDRLFRTGEMPAGCLNQLIDLQRHAKEYVHRDGLLAEDELFYAEQNARTVKNTAEYARQRPLRLAGHDT